MKHKIVDCIVKTESIYEEIFTDKVETTYGLLFFDQNHPNVADRNHAIILPDRVEYRTYHKNSDRYFMENMKEALEDIKRFYQEKGLVPKIYSPLYRGFLEQIEPILRENNYKIQRKPSRNFLVLPSEGKKEPENMQMECHSIAFTKESDFKVKRLKAYSEELMNRIYNTKVAATYHSGLKDAFAHPNFHYYVGYEGDVPVVTGSIYYASYHAAKVMSLTALTRKQGLLYSRYMLHYMVERHKKNSKLPLYLEVTNPATRKLFLEAGFLDYNLSFESWSAVLQ